MYIFWTDGAHLHIHRYVKILNCRTRAKENSFGHQPVPLHSEKVSLWCGFTTSFIAGLFIFEEIGPARPVTCTVNSVLYGSLLRNHVIPSLQKRVCVDSAIIMQDGAPPHIGISVKRFLSMHFGNDRIISRHFPTNLSPRSPDLNPCDFWLWGYLKHVVFSDCKLS
ncbi:hypothetical protein AVEN_106097-1 [Araneus ventricosus]|uniref:Tc1-like transposase DDE domain-containing protein n=1 Tax=Araneus ventricosus TaxID=182803 RepID=A0A4Y2HT82_ARAVE|nr:hypothetical protein AVEN_106097-1 [Araneus ventricosus]